MNAQDLQKLREVYEKRINKNSGGAGGVYFTPPEGETVIRILPRSPFFYKETATHTIDNNQYFCPKYTRGERCPVCETVNTLYKGDENDKKQAKDLKAKKKFYTNVIIRGEREAEGPKVWTFGIQMFDLLLAKFFDNDYGDLTDIAAGNDWKVIRGKKGDYVNYDLSAPRPVKTPLHTDKAKIKEWLEKAHNLDNLVEPYVKSYGELKAILLGETPATNASSDSADAPAKAAAPAKSEVKKVVVKAPPAEPDDASEEGTDDILKEILAMKQSGDNL